MGGVNSIPNAGAEFGIERAEFSYAFTPALELFAGWPISSVDIGTGGLLYGDDHPIIGFRGKVTDNIKYQLALYQHPEHAPDRRRRIYPGA